MNDKKDEATENKSIRMKSKAKYYETMRKIKQQYKCYVPGKRRSDKEK
jgi:hypothetical protein